MIVYVASDLDFQVNCFTDLQSKRKSNNGQVNFLACPAVRRSWQNVWMFGVNRDIIVNYDLDNVNAHNNPVTVDRLPHLKDTNIFSLCMANYFFSESPLKIKVTAPYFHKAEYQKDGTFIGGIFDIGRWYRPIQTEIITWQESGTINFKKGEPIFYAEFLTDEKITLVKYKHSNVLSGLSMGLIGSPFQTPKNFEGTLDTRYEAFDRSSYREAILKEIKANLVSEDEASPSV